MSTIDTGIVTMSTEVIEELIEEVEEVLDMTDLDIARKRLIGIRMSLRSLRKEANRKGLGNGR